MPHGFVTAFNLGSTAVVPNRNAIIFCNGQELKLQPKVIAVLCILAKNYPEPVSRDDLIDEVWDGNYYIGRKALTNAVWQLRKSLNDAMHVAEHNVETAPAVEAAINVSDTAPNLSDTQQTDSGVIETVRKLGYRLKIEPLSDIPVDAGPFGGAHADRRKSQSTRWSALSLKHRPYVNLIFLFVAVEIAIYALWYFSNRAIQDKPVFTHLTKSVGSEQYPSLSPSGRYLAYTWDRDLNSKDIFIQDLSSPISEKIKITQDDYEEGPPIWSADGKWLYFITKNAYKNQCTVKQLELATGIDSIIGRCPISSNLWLDLAKNTGQLAYVSTIEKGSAPKLVIHNLESNKKHILEGGDGEYCSSIADSHFALSPNGDKVVVAHIMGELGHELWLHSITTNKRHKIGQVFYDFAGIDWHPNRSEFIVAHNVRGRRIASTYDEHGNETARINIDGIGFPSYSKSGDSLVYQKFATTNYIASLSTDASQMSVPFPFLSSGAEHGEAHYSPKADKVAFISSASGSREIWVSDASGNFLQQLTHSSLNSRYPRWSHDGRKIAFLGTEDLSEGNHVYILNVETRIIQKLKSPFRSHGRPSWSEQDDAIIVSSILDNNLNLYKLSLDGQETQTLHAENGIYGKEKNGSLYYSNKDTGGIWKTTLNTPPHTELILSEQEFNLPYYWEVTDKGIYYITEHQRYNQVYFHSFASKKNQAIIRLPRSLIVHDGSISYIDKTKTLLLTESSHSSSDVKLLNLNAYFKKHKSIESLDNNEHKTSEIYRSKL